MNEKIEPFDEQPYDPESRSVHDHEQAHAHDDTYANEPPLRDMPFTIWNIPRMLVLALIRGYQMTFSRALPQGSCRFYPSCSHYGYQAVYKHGFFKGILMGAYRVLRCNPFNPGGYDPVP